MQAPEISIVVPAYNEAESLPELCTWIDAVMLKNQLSYEIIVVDDGSTDNSWEVLQEICKNNFLVKAFRFNRNYGKSAALQTGFQEVSGRVTITMDADLQDDPEEIPALYKMIVQDKFDLVSGWKQKRKDPISKTIPTKLFNAATRWLSGIKLNDFNCGLKAYDSRVVKSIEVYGEMHRYIPILAKWAGYKKITEKKVAHHARKYGYTKFGLERFVFGFLDLLSVTFTSRFKKRPMHFFGSFGVLSFTSGFFITLHLIYEKVRYLYLSEKAPFREITQQPLFYLALVAIVVGVQLFLAGFLAEMIVTNSSKTNDYVVAEKLNSQT
jgi:glycosyltransferase involved in cell wall biosynthesis